MRTTKLIGLGMVIAGAVLITVGSGAFDASEANRGMAIETADDEDAFLGVEYPEGETVELESSDATGGFCFFGACADFEYDDVTVVELTDNSGGLTVDSIETEVNNDDITGGDGVRDEPSTELREVVGDFRCPSSGSFLGQGGQDSREEVVTVDVQTSGGVEVEIEREVDVECIPD